METQTNKPRRQHFVPKMLSRNFGVDNEGRLYCFDKRFDEKCVRKIKLENFFLERNIYTLRDEDGNKDFSAETDFSKLEKETAEIIGKIIEAARVRKLPGLTPSEKKTLDWFLLCQWMRVPDRSDPAVERVLEKVSFRHPRIKDFSDEERNRFKREIRVTGVTRSIKTPSKKILSALEHKGLAVGVTVSGNESFVIGSNPVLKTPPGYYLFGRIVQVWLPIASDVAVTPYFPRGVEDFIEFEDEGIRSFNKEVFEQSNAIAGNSEELVKRAAGL